MINANPQYFGCPELETFLYDYVERELDQHVLIAFDNHILVCRDCERMTDSYRSSVETARTHIAREVHIPEKLKTEIIELLDSTPA